MRTTFSVGLIVCALLVGASASRAAHGESGGTGKAGVESILGALPADAMATVIVQLRDRAVLPSQSSGRGSGRGARIRAVVDVLREKAATSQRRLRALLRRRSDEGKVKRFTPLWVVNAISVTATPEVVREVADRPEVESISSDAVDLVPATGAPEPNLAAVGAASAWAAGDTGQGVVVASLDSGVDASHPDLAARWRGGTNSWFDPYGQHGAGPIDLTGHGTGTMGVVVGGDAGGTSIGVAPGAEWIAARIWNDRGRSKVTAIHQAFQWLLDPDGDPGTDDAPDVVNASWSFGSPSTCNLTFQPDVQALRAAGIVSVFAAGNYGPGASSDVSPANYPEALSVGAVDNGDGIATDSSRGPSSCGGSSVYPRLVAPGVGILSTAPYGLYTVASGTSLAAPHVTGALALLLSAHPGLSPDEQENALEQGAHDLGSPGPDDDFGFGRLDVPGALAAVGSSDVAGPLTSDLELTPNPSNASADVALRATADDSATGGSGVAAAEYSIDGAAPQPMAVGAGGPVTDLQAAIPASTVAGLVDGAHSVSVRSRDGRGNWGEAVAASLIVDTTPPMVTTALASPSPSEGAAAVMLTATAADAGTVVVGAEWFTGVDPGPGAATAMTVGGAGSPWQLTATIDVGSWAPGSHDLYVRARDAAGNWSAVATAVLVVSTAPPAPLLLFSTLGTEPPPPLGVGGAADLYAWDGATFSHVMDATADYGLPPGANVDGFDQVDADHFYVSFADDTSVPGLGTAHDEDVFYYDAGAWSLYFEGSAHGLTSNRLGLDAVAVVDGVLYFSTSGNANPPGVKGRADDSDTYSWDGTKFARVWDATAYGLPGKANVDGYARVDATHFYLSFSGSTTPVPGLGVVEDEDCVYFGDAGWELSFDGTAHGLGGSQGFDVDAFDLT